MGKLGWEILVKDNLIIPVWYNINSLGDSIMSGYIIIAYCTCLAHDLK